MDELYMVVEVRLFERGDLKAFADVTFRLQSHDEVTIRGFRVIRSGSANPWVAYPSNSYPKDGKYVNKPILEMPRGLKKQIDDAVLAEFEKKVAERV